jgi:phosphoserine phosphatase
MKRKYDLVCFDLDGTLIEEENGDVLWERMSGLIHGTREVTNKRYEAYEKGELNIEDWFEMDVSEWKSHGVTKNMLIRESKHSKLIDGVKETLKFLKKEGYRLAVISGSVDILLDTVFPDHPFDEVFMNKLLFDNLGKLTSWEKMRNVNGRKDLVLMEIAKRENIPLSRTVFVGDHLNDIPAAKIAGLAIAFNSDTKELRKVCDAVIEKKDMREILKHIVQ